MISKPTRNRVAVCYHYFAHYRQTIIETLIKHGAYNYHFYGADYDPTDGNVKCYSELPKNRFHKFNCWQVFGLLLIQPKILTLPFGKNTKAVIFLGNPYMPFTWLAAIICKLTKVRVLYWTHGWRRPESGITGKVRKLFYQLADGLLVYEHRAKCIGIELGFDPDSIYVVYNSLKFDEQTVLYQKFKNDQRALDLKKEALFNNQNKVIICSSRLIENRNIDLLIRAVASLNSNEECFNLLVVGDGPQKAELETLARQANVNAQFVGECYDESILATYFMMSVATVSPGPIGLMAIHSFSYGVPVIVNDEPDFQGPEWGTIVSGVNGSFFKKGDIQSMANEILYWTKPDIDQQKIQRNCRAVVDRAYNPNFQTKVIDRAVRGEPADDLQRIRINSAQ